MRFVLACVDLPSLLWALPSCIDQDGSVRYSIVFFWGVRGGFLSLIQAQLTGTRLI